MKSENTVFIILTVLFVLVLISLVVLIGVFIVNFNKKTRFIIGKMNSADNRDKYAQLRKEFRCHYLCLIPFVNKRNVLNLYNLLFYKPKHKLVQKRTDGIWHIIAPSLMGFCVCAVCLCGATFAWFTSTQTSSVADIQTATYTVSVAVDKDIEVTKNNYAFEIPLESGETYVITITAIGTANNGYCEVAFGDKTYYTSQIEKGATFNFTVEAQESDKLTLTPQWGTCTKTDNIINCDMTIGYEPEPQ